MSDAACPRCGTFAPTWALTPALCGACSTRLLEEQRFWPPRTIGLLGVLLNPVIGAVLLALNFRRLGDSAKAARFGGLGAVLLLVYGAIIALNPPIPNGVLIGAGFGLGFMMSRQWEEVWKIISPMGARKASSWLAVLFSLLAVGGLVVAVAAISVLGEDDGLFEP